MWSESICQSAKMADKTRGRKGLSINVFLWLSLLPGQNDSNLSDEEHTDGRDMSDGGWDANNISLASAWSVPSVTTCLSMQPKLSSAHLSFHALTIVTPFSPDFQRLIGKLQRIQNNAARLIFQSSTYDHVSSLLESLHWLAIIDYKLSSLSLPFCSHWYWPTISLWPLTSSRQLRSSSDDKILWIPTLKTQHNSQRTFSYQGPSTWNMRPGPHSVRHASASTIFKSLLKTHLFKQ